MFAMPEGPTPRHTALYEKLKAGGALLNFQEWSRMTARIHVDVPAHPNFFYRHELRTEGWASTTPGAEYRVELFRVGQEGRSTICATHASLNWAEAADMVDYLHHLASMLNNPASRAVLQCGPTAPCDSCGKEVSPGPGPHINVDHRSGQYLTCHGQAVV